jgi:hypothetical protein
MIGNIGPVSLPCPAALFHFSLERTTLLLDEQASSKTRLQPIWNFASEIKSCCLKQRYTRPPSKSWLLYERHITLLGSNHLGIGSSRSPESNGAKSNGAKISAKELHTHRSPESNGAKSNGAKISAKELHTHH